MADISYNYTASDLSNNITYTVEVSSRNINGRETKAGLRTARPLGTPSSITDISATAVGSATATIGFVYLVSASADIATDISGFDISYAVLAGGVAPQSLIVSRTAADISRTTVTVSAGAGASLVNKTAYRLGVRAININGTRSAGWTDISFTPLATPLAPSLSGNGTDGQIVLTWSAAAADVGYVSSFRLSRGGVVTMYDATSTGATITGLTNGVTYDFSLCVVNINGVVGAAASVSLAPSVPVMTTYRSITSGVGHSGAVRADGTVVSWGNNGSGQLGLGTTTNIAYATAVPNISNAVSVACGNETTLFLLANGEVRACGLNSNGQLGIGNITAAVSNISAVKDIYNVNNNLTGVVHVSSGSVHSCFVLNNGKVAGCGNTGSLSDNCPLGNGLSVNTLITSPVILKEGLADMNNIVQVACGNGYTLFLTGGGRVKSCGNNNNGQLGLGTTTNTSTPTIITDLSNIVYIITQNNTSLALHADGSVYGWGVNTFGQINGTTTANVLSPLKIRDSGSSFLSGVVDVSIDSITSHFVLYNGQVRSLGTNTSGQYGNGTTTKSSYADNASRMLSSAGVTLSNIVNVSSGSGFTMALSVTGAIRGVGTQLNGVVGDGNNSAINTTMTYPVTVKLNASTDLSNVIVRKPGFSAAPTFTPVKDTTYSVQALLGLYNTAFQYQPGTVQARGLAITGFTGTWQYSTTGSAGSYTTIGIASDTYATLLQADPNVWIKTTTDGSTLSVKAWDRRYNGTIPAYGLAVVGVDTTASDAFTASSFS